MEFLILVIFIAEIFSLALIDRILFGTFITPVTVLSVPYLIIVIFAITIGPYLGFVAFYLPSLWIWIIGLFLFWLPGLILSFISLEKTKIHDYPFVIHENFQLDSFIYIFSYILVAVLFLGIFKSLSTYQIGSEELESSLGVGIIAHTSIVSKFFFIYLIVRFKKKNLIPILLLMIIYFLYGAKSWILIPVFSSVMIRIILKKNHLSFFLILKIITFGIIVFYSTYRVVLGPSMPFSFIYNHFFVYTFSGVLGLSEHFRLNGNVGIDPLMLINPIINVYNKISGIEIIDTFSKIETSIGCNAYTNVKTFFGSIYLYAGVGWGALFSLIFGFLSYFFLIITIKTKSIILFIIYATHLTLLLLGWFDIYSSNLFFYEFPLFGILFYSLYSILVLNSSFKKAPIIKRP